MAIQRRTSIPTGDQAEVDETKGLNIVARPKQPMPPAKVTTIYETGPARRRLGTLSLALGNPTADEGFTVGDTVKMLRTATDQHNPQEQRYRDRIKNRATAITALCVSCTGSRKLVTECLSTQCPLWAFRFGTDPFRGKRK